MDIFEESDLFAEELHQMINIPLYDYTDRTVISDIACSLSLEHWQSVRVTLQLGCLPSALVVHRAQFEALVRSFWILFSATEQQLSKLNANLNLESEQASKNMPQISKMMQALEKNCPKKPYIALTSFQENSMKALNSYVHAGIHPIRRHSEGYPIQLIYDSLRNANNLAFLSCMHAVILSDRPELQHNLYMIAKNRSACMPPLL